MSVAAIYVLAAAVFPLIQAGSQADSDMDQPVQEASRMPSFTLEQYVLYSDMDQPVQEASRMPSFTLEQYVLSTVAILSALLWLALLSLGFRWAINVFSRNHHSKTSNFTPVLDSDDVTGKRKLSPLSTGNDAGKSAWPSKSGEHIVIDVSSYIDVVEKCQQKKYDRTKV